MEDLNNNNLVDIKDLNLMLKNWSDDLNTIKNKIIDNWGKIINNKGVFVSHSGNDNNSGTFFSPVQTLSKAIELANNSDIIYLRGEANNNIYYFEEEDIDKSVTITKYGNENPVIDGTKTVRELTDDLEWKLENQTIIDDNNVQQTVTLYKIILKENTKVWQCFHNREEVMGARYPSAQWRDNSVYEINSSERPTRWCWGYNNVEADATAPYDNGEIIDYPHDNINLRLFVDKVTTINANFTLKDALIHLNVGSYRSYTKSVNSTTLETNGDIKLTYDPTKEWKKKHHHFY